MKMIDNPICLLAIEERPNSFLPINLCDLGFDIPGSTMTLSELDKLIFIHTEEYIREKIKTNNIIPEYAFHLPLVILYQDENNYRRKLSLIPSEYYFKKIDFDCLLADNLEDKVFLNRLYNKIRLLNIDDKFKSALVSFLKFGLIEEFMGMFTELPYIIQRDLNLFIVNTVKKQNIRIREKTKEEVE